jgi:hypothetical protein
MVSLGREDFPFALREMHKDDGAKEFLFLGLATLKGRSHSHIDIAAPRSSTLNRSPNVPPPMDIGVDPTAPAKNRKTVNIGKLKRAVVEIFHHTAFLKEQLRLTKDEPENMSITQSIKL